MYVESFGCLLDSGRGLIASQLPQQGKTMSVLARSCAWVSSKRRLPRQPEA
jgi:hypothetical protein